MFDFKLLGLAEEINTFLIDCDYLDSIPATREDGRRFDIATAIELMHNPIEIMETLQSIAAGLNIGGACKVSAESKESFYIDHEDIETFCKIAELLKRIDCICSEYEMME